MVLESNGYGVREQRFWCSKVIVLVLESNGYVAREERFLCSIVTVVETV
jgi:hypothetical protein